MKILHLSSEYPPQQVFGLGRFVRDLAEEQVRQGHEATVITNSMGGNLPESVRNGVRVLRVHYPPPPKPTTANGCVLVFNILILQRALGFGPEELSGFDVICSHDWLTAPAAQVLSSTFGPTHISTFHDTIVGKRLGRIESEVDRFSAEAERWTVHAATHVIANSTATKRELVNVYGASPDRISVVPCAIAPETFKVTNDVDRLAAFRESLFPVGEILILYVGRLDPEKGIGVLLEAFARAGLSRAVLCIVGAGILLDGLRKKAEDLGIKDKVRFLGYIENPVLGYLYRCADILVCPSLYEPFGMVALEGMLQGTPAIVSDTGGLSDLVDEGKTGLLVRPGDPTALADALRRVAQDSDLRQKMGAAARQSVLEERTWPTACRKTIEVYRKNIDSRSPLSHDGAEHLFVASDLNPGSGYSAGRIARALFEEIWERKGQVDRITTGNDDLLQIQAANRQDSMILEAFNMAAKLLQHATRPPKSIASYHWNGLLASSVLMNRKEKPIVRHFSPPVRRLEKSAGEVEKFEQSIQVWAAGEATEVFAPDEPTGRLLAANSVVSKVEPFGQLALSKPNVVDAALFRASFAEPSEYLAVVAMRLSPPFWGKTLLDTARMAAESGIPLRWVICGDGVLLPGLKEAAKNNRLPMCFTGHLPDITLGAVLSVSDVEVVPSQEACATPFIQEASMFSLPVIASFGTASMLEEKNSHVTEVDFAQPAQVVNSLARVLGIPERTTSIAQRRTPAAGTTRAAFTSDAASTRTPTQIVLYNNWGIGDEFLLSAVAREIKRAYPEKRLWIRSRFGFRFPGFCEAGHPPASAIEVETIYQNMVLFGPLYHAPFPDHLVQQMLDKVALDTGIRVQARSHVPEVELDGGVGEREWNTIILHCKPNSRLPSKDWGMQRWIQLCELLHKRGLRIVQVGDKGEPRLPHAEDQRGLPPRVIPELVSRAGLVVCLVGFLMHVAAATETPAIVIYGGREHPAIDGYPGQIHLCGELVDCRGRWGCHTAPDAECPHGMRCMESLTPDLVDHFAGKIILSKPGARI